MRANIYERDLDVICEPIPFATVAPTSNSTSSGEDTNSGSNSSGTNNTDESSSTDESADALALTFNMVTLVVGIALLAVSL